MHWNNISAEFNLYNSSWHVMPSSRTYEIEDEFEKSFKNMKVRIQRINDTDHPTGSVYCTSNKMH